MRIEAFALERWLTTYEPSFAENITESGVAVKRVAELPRNGGIHNGHV